MRLVRRCAAESTDAVHSRLISVAHAVQRVEPCSIRDWFEGVLETGKHELAMPGDCVQPPEYIQRIIRERHNVIATAFIAVLHGRGRSTQFTRVPIEPSPTCHAQLRAAQPRGQYAFEPKP